MAQPLKVVRDGFKMVPCDQINLRSGKVQGLHSNWGHDRNDGTGLV